MRSKEKLAERLRAIEAIIPAATLPADLAESSKRDTKIPGTHTPTGR